MSGREGEKKLENALSVCEKKKGRWENLLCAEMRVGQASYCEIDNGGGVNSALHLLLTVKGKEGPQKEI